MEERQNEELVPIGQVLEDMYEDSGVEYEARRYYYDHYASDEERKVMDREDMIHELVAIGIAAVFIVTTIVAFVQILFGRG